jgi:hypothetical protein
MTAQASALPSAYVEAVAKEEHLMFGELSRNVRQSEVCFDLKSLGRINQLITVSRITGPAYSTYYKALKNYF